MWLKNPDYRKKGFSLDLSVGDRLLVAVPLHLDSGNGYDIHLIYMSPVGTGFEDVYGQDWIMWTWSEIEYYSVIKDPTEGKP